MIDIVVPVFNAYDATLKCLNHLEENDDLANLVYLIDDASTDERIRPLLKQKATENSWELIENESNLGFVKTANIGLKASDNSTVLLNSDAFVTPYWLHGLKQCLETVHHLGTATVWSNNAELASFPQFLQAHPPQTCADKLAIWLRAHHQPEYPEVPTAVGFCMLVTALAKEKVGYFDEEQFGHGYGEENDYSLRVTEAGLKNIICDNCYVTHWGNESFNEKGLKPNDATMQRLLEKQPEYLKIISKFIDKDPLAGVRGRILESIRNTDNDLYNRLGIAND